MKQEVSLGFKHLRSDSGLAQFAMNVLGRMKDNPKFNAIQDPLVSKDLNGLVNRYNLALQEAADGSRTKIEEKRVVREQLVDTLHLVARHLSILSGGQGALILEAGFDVRRHVTASVPVLEQVSGLKASQSGPGAEVVLTYNGVPQARMYVAEWSADDGKTWQTGSFSTSTRCVLQGLPPRQDALIRLTALGSKQRRGAPSIPLRFFVV